MKQMLLLLSLVILFTSCARRRMMERVQQYNIRTIAILPAQLEVVGNLPRNTTPEAFQRQVEQNRRFIQQALYIDLVQFVDTRLRRMSQVQFQSLDRTRSLLAENNIADSVAWEKDPAELARLLGVDAVVNTKITQNRVMSDEAALGVDVVGGILNQTIPRANLPTGAARTSDIFVTCGLSRDGYTVWSTRFRNSTDWNYPVQMAIQNITRRIAQNFPL
ncbi:MAG TPA: hypothetical protein PKE63_11760 [Lacibacter sp.]|nr:hypothetical protein [Lacibacter sp.]HMO88042.1 hypothetical protein [Lacibacter sp.]HMP87948.1 hypothetical protein [Lacibacter sp.]